MTKLDTVIDYAKSLPLEAQNKLAEDILRTMQSQTPDISLTAEEIEDVKQAMAETNPKYASAEDVKSALGYS